ncbi:MAG: hypothetical protein ACOCYG_10055, partial [Spirochaetota bacterium]
DGHAHLLELEEHTEVGKPQGAASGKGQADGPAGRGLMDLAESGSRDEEKEGSREGRQQQSRNEGNHAS